MKKSPQLPNFFRGFFGTLKRNPKVFIIPAVLLALGAGVAIFNASQASANALNTDESSALFGFFASRSDQLEVVKAGDPRKLIHEDTASLTSVSKTAVDNTALNTESIAMASVVYTNPVTEASVLPPEVEAAPTAYTVERPAAMFSYTVQPGETLSSIARKFGLSPQTLLADAKWDELVKPGQKISIPSSNSPIHKVAEGQSLSQIAQRYGATNVQKLIEGNNLPEDGTVQPGQLLVVFGGNVPDKPVEQPATTQTRRLASASRSTSSRTTSRTSTSRSVSRGISSGGSYSGFPAGYCTYYVAKKRGDVTWRGNAGTWLNNAKAQGRATGNTPKAGAIVVTPESGWGHVGIVDSVNKDGSYNISEMNYAGFGKVSTRTLNSNSNVKGFIY